MFYGWCYTVQYHSFVGFVRITQEGYWSVTLWNRKSPSQDLLVCLHSVGILFSMKYVFSIISSHLWALGPRFFSCSTKTSFVVLQYFHSFLVLFFAESILLSNLFLLLGEVYDASTYQRVLLFHVFIKIIINMNTDS